MALTKISTDGTETGGSLASKINLGFDVTDANEVAVQDLDTRVQTLESTSGIAPQWGSIQGTLSAQTDLQNALDSKADVNGNALSRFQVADGVVGNDAVNFGQLSVVNQKANTAQTGVDANLQLINQINQKADTAQTGVDANLQSINQLNQKVSAVEVTAQNAESQANLALSVANTAQNTADSKQDDLGLGTPGQILATNAAADGTEWVDIRVDDNMLKSVYDTNDNGIVDNAEKVNNHTVETDVPVGAVFTDTVYDDTALSDRVSTNETNIATLQTSLDGKLDKAGDTMTGVLKMDAQMVEFKRTDPSQNQFILGYGTDGVGQWSMGRLTVGSDKVTIWNNTTSTDTYVSLRPDGEIGLGSEGTDVMTISNANGAVFDKVPSSNNGPVGSEDLTNKSYVDAVTAPKGGDTSTRPVDPALYTTYFDTDINKLIVCNDNTTGANVWVDTMGTVV